MNLDTEVLRLRALVEAGRLVHQSLDVDRLLDNILVAATSTVGAARGTVYVCDDDKRELWSRVTAGPERLEIRLPYGKGMAGFTAEKGEVLKVDDVRSSPLFDPEVDRRTGFRTENALCVPIRDRQGGVASVIQLLNKPGGFTQDDVQFLTLMGDQVAQAIENARTQQLLLASQKMARELELARRIQTLLLPARLPTVPGVQAAARMVTSREVGGDYYDVIALPGGRHLFVVADVSGKGVAAALVMSNLQAALLATTALGLDLPAWVAHLNNVIYDRLEGSRYATVALLLLEADATRARLVNAGHPPVLLRLADGTVRRLESTGPPLGMLPASSFEELTFELPEGAQLLLYSDGLNEAAGLSGEELGIEGVERLLVELAALAPDPAADAMLAAVAAHSSGGPEPDDRTLMVLRRG
ncbi:MAG: SpoIIE family protein phosphatase [Vicinamibacteria bacterium]|jgi:phosphoserine phosphatase|nr:SpoIIE family protein phosphatase [Vicinamibacteria bacterium]MCL4821396.1 SpoIIE family protein phosphatase [Vicinamibacteria bacterium]